LAAEAEVNCRSAKPTASREYAFVSWRVLKSRRASERIAKSAGDMYPETFYAHLIAMLEIMVGMFGLAVVTGLIFVRFSRPTARMHFRIDETEDLALI
jgi:hypothetical protein